MRTILKWGVAVLCVLALVAQFVPALSELRIHRTSLLIFCLAGVLGYFALEPKKLGADVVPPEGR